MDLKTPFSLVISEPPKSGKSHLAKYIIYKLDQENQFDWIFIISGTAGIDKTLNFIPKNRILPPPTGMVDLKNGKKISKIDLLLSKIMNAQKEFKEKGSNKRLLLIFDDIIGSVGFKSESISKLAATYRHYNISLIIITQHLHYLHPLVRNSSGYAALFRQENQDVLKASYESYGGSFKNLKEWENFISSQTNEHHFIWVDRNSNVKEDMYTALKAPESLPTHKIKSE
jgi:hypothetical protein